MARGRTYELAFRIGGQLSAGFTTATGIASKRLALLQRQGVLLARQQQLTRAWRGVGRAFSGVSSQVGSLAFQIAAASGLAAGGLFMLARSTAEVGDRAIKMGQNLGVDVGVLQELWYAAERTGAAQEDLNLALRQMHVQLGQAVAGTGEARRYLDQLGLSAQDLARMKPEEALETLADAIGKLPTVAEKAAVSQSLFGRGAKKLGVLLDQGGGGMRRLRKEARATGGVLGREAAEDAAKFNDRLLDLRLSFAGIKTTIGAALMPIFTRMFERLAKWLQSNQGRVKELADRFVLLAERSIPKLKELADRVSALAGKALDLLVSVKDMAGGWESLGLILAAVRFAPIVAGIVNLTLALWGASTAAWSFAAALLANPITWLVVGLAAQVALITLAIVHWDRWTAALRKSSAAIKTIVAVLGWLTLPLWLIPALIVVVVKHWGLIVGAVKAAGLAVADFAVAAWERISAIAAWIWDRMQWAWGGIRLVILAAVEVIGLILAPIAEVIAAFGRLLGAVWAWVWEAIQPAVAIVVALFVGLASKVWAAMVWLFDVIVAGWATAIGALSSLWDQWGDSVIATVRWVAARALEILAAPLRVGLALASMAPTAAAPHLAELTTKLSGSLDRGVAAVEGPRPKPLAQSSAALSGAMATREQGRQNSTALSVAYSPQITVQGDASRADIAAAVKAGADDLLERLQAAQEKQDRLAYG